MHVAMCIWVVSCSMAANAILPTESPANGIVMAQGEKPATVSRQTSGTAKRTKPAPPRRQAKPESEIEPLIPRLPPINKAFP
jgi:hypothetical protein